MSKQRVSNLAGRGIPRQNAISLSEQEALNGGKIGEMTLRQALQPEEIMKEKRKLSEKPDKGHIDPRIIGLVIYIEIRLNERQQLEIVVSFTSPYIQKRYGTQRPQRYLYPGRSSSNSRSRSKSKSRRPKRSSRSRRKSKSRMFKRSSRRRRKSKSRTSKRSSRMSKSKSRSQSSRSRSKSEPRSPKRSSYSRISLYPHLKSKNKSRSLSPKQPLHPRRSSLPPRSRSKSKSRSASSISRRRSSRLSRKSSPKRSLHRSGSHHRSLNRSFNQPLRLSPGTANLEEDEALDYVFRKSYTLHKPIRGTQGGRTTQ